MLALRALCLLWIAATPVVAQVSGYWENFPLPGTDGPIYTSLTSEGTLILGGNFTYAESERVNHLAIWDPFLKVWFPLGGGVNGPVYALAEQNGVLYVGGAFTEAYNPDGTVVPASGVVRWEDGAWYPLGQGVLRYDFGPTTVRALAVDSLRGGVFVGGHFPGVQNADGSVIASTNIAYWNGSTWEPLGEGISDVQGTVYALVYNAPLQQLYAGGTFDFWKGKNLARWNVALQQWESLGDVTGCPFFDVTCSSLISNGAVYALKLIGKYRLFVGGNFNNTGELSVSGLGYYSIIDSVWLPAPAVNHIVRTFLQGDPAVVFAGDFDAVTWNGVTDSLQIAEFWPLATPPEVKSPHGFPPFQKLDGTIYTLSQLSGHGLFVGGTFRGSRSVYTRNILQEGLSSGDSTTWVVPHENDYLGISLTSGTQIEHIARQDSLLLLYAPGLVGAGTIRASGDLVVLNLATGVYTSVDGTFNGPIYDVALHRDRYGNLKVYVAGDFDEVTTRNGAVQTGPVAVCDLDQLSTNCWTAPYNNPVPVQSGAISSLVVTDTALVLGGNFIAGVPGVDEIWGLGYYKQDGWHHMAPGYWALYPYQPGTARPGLYGGAVFTLEVVDNKIWAGGDFVYVDTVYAERLAYWDGTRWYRPAPSVPEDAVRDLKAKGKNLFLLHERGLSILDRVSRTWVKSSANDDPIDLAVYTDTEGNVVDIDTLDGQLRTLIPVSEVEAYVGGHFERIGNVPVEHFALWDGSSWQAVPPPTIALSSTGKPTIFAAEAQELDIYVGGRFDSVAGLPTGNLSVWHAGAPTYATVDVRIEPALALSEGCRVDVPETPRVNETVVYTASPAADWYFLGWKVENAGFAFLEHAPLQLKVTPGSTPAILTAYFVKMKINTAAIAVDYPTPDGSWESAPDTLIEGNTVRVQMPFTFVGPSGGTLQILLRTRDTGDTLQAPSIRYARSNPQEVMVNPSTQGEVIHYWDTDGMAWRSPLLADPTNPWDHDLVMRRSVEIQARPQLSGLDLNASASPIVRDSFAVFFRPRPLIMVHGLWSDASTWDSMKTFPEKGIYTFAVGDGVIPGKKMDTGSIAILNFKPFTATTIDDNAQTLRDYIEGIRQQTKAQEVDIIAHSMGGLISRQYIHKYMQKEALPLWNPRPPVRFLFTLGTPHWGSPCADLLYTGATLFSLYQLVKNLALAAGAIKSGQWYLLPKTLSRIFLAAKGVLGYDRMNIWQLTTRYGRIFNRQITELNGVRVFGLGGYYVSLTCSGGPGDLVVELASALPDQIAGMTADQFFVSKVRMQPISHLAMTGSRSIYHDLIRPAIDGGRLPESGTYPLHKTLEDSLDIPLFYPVFGIDTTLSAPITISFTFEVDLSGASLEGFAIGPEGWQWELVDPNGVVQDSLHPGSPRQPFPGVIFLHAPVPAQGTWMLRGTPSGGASGGRIMAGAALSLPEIFLEQEMHPDTIPPFIQGHLRNPQGQVFPADSILILIAPEDTTDFTLQIGRMVDDGQHFDGAADDGIYGIALPALEDSITWVATLAFYQGRIFHEVNQVIHGQRTGTYGEKTPAPETPEAFQILDLYPRPSSRWTTLRFALPTAGKVSLEIYDLLGRRVLFDQRSLSAGIHTWRLHIQHLSAGVYVLRLTYRQTSRHLLLPVVH
ncbi:T9SS type A sorting domain-containing protein [Rhodothermus marinus]|uniref:alpha/beta hydrolase n=1 Tax=Rhodothermus marinus TaxID=29549 RepID=UPI0037CB7C4D